MRVRRFSPVAMLSFKLEKDGNQYHAFCPELKGCHTFGSTPEEALSNLKNAVALYVEDEMEEQTLNGLVEEAKKNVQT
jgi:predicted RNase H-like HicB family nuclease